MALLIFTINIDGRAGTATFVAVDRRRSAFRAAAFFDAGYTPTPIRGLVR
ncbi:hypothetical protein [Methyloversatilis sp.]